MRDKGCGRQRFAASFLNILKILLDRCRVPLKKYTAPVKVAEKVTKKKRGYLYGKSE